MSSKNVLSFLFFSFFLITRLLSNSSYSNTTTNFELSTVQNDINGDGELNILILGSNLSINSGHGFSPDVMAEELEKILIQDGSIDLEINVIAEDIHKSKPVLLGLGGGGTEYTWTHHSHSLIQYYYWPEGYEERMMNLSGQGEYVWDYVVINADLYIISNTPGYYALGVHKLASKITEGGAEVLLQMMWAKEGFSDIAISHFEEFTYRAADGAKEEITVIPSGLTWDSLSEDKKDDANNHPSPNGAYVCAASIYAELFEQSASNSDYMYDDEIADWSYSVVNTAKQVDHYSGVRTFLSPFMSCNISDDTINYSHTGTSSENGIKAGMEWVFNQSEKTIQRNGPSPLNLNYGRANTNFEANKRYQVDPNRFDFSFGFPMQDHGNHGNTSMLYGIDRRQSGTTNDTDLGVARYMISESELPYGRAIPIRTLYALIQEDSPGQSAYRDSWHMHRDLDKAIGAYMFTLLTGTCAIGKEPADSQSDAWKTWNAHRIGYETAWTLMYLDGNPPECSLLVDEDRDGFVAVVDCDDNNEMINPNQVEIVYNGMDDDCNPATLDDDLDQDGFSLQVDCNDNDASINPNQIEIAYNGIDDDCEPSTLDDDLDEDGFKLEDDCDDMNAMINPDQIEVVYNGIDDDCDPLTLDDDLDEDGFTNEEDCDDNNPDINPDAEEILNNGIDEDCDGMDLVTSTFDLLDLNIHIFPNPTSDYIHIRPTEQKILFDVSLIDVAGNTLISKKNVNRLDVHSIPSGMYILEVKGSRSNEKAYTRIIVN